MDWQVSSMECRVQEGDLSDVVYLVHWRCSATETDGDKTYSGSVYSSCVLPAPDAADFTPYDQLTKEQVLGWLWANGVDKDATEAAVLQQIELQKHPVVVNLPPPWSQA
jgi:hypothetical protein